MTIEEVKKAAETSPELKTAIVSSFKDDFVKGATAEGLVVRTKEEDQSYLDNHVKTVVDEKVSKELQTKVDAEFSKALSKIDEEIKSITGIEKNASEKTTAYAKRALAEIKSKGGDPVTKEKVTELEKLLSSTKEDYEKKLKDSEEKIFSKEIEFQVDADLSTRTIAIPSHLKTDAEKQAYVKEEKEMLKQRFLTSVKPKRDNEGNIVYYDGDKPLMSTKDGKPLKAGDIIGEKFSTRFVPQSQQQTGTGFGQDGNGNGTGGGAFKSKEDIHKHLAAQGIEAGTKAYYNEFEKLATENKLTV